MRQVWSQIGLSIFLSIIITVVVWFFCVVGVIVGGFTESMDEYDFLWLLLPVLMIVTTIVMIIFAREYGGPRDCWAARDHSD